MDDRLSDDDATRQQVRNLLGRLGQREAARRLGVHMQTVLALAAGARVQPGSLALVRERLAAALAEP
jgi:DNA-binding XRE family transcriptional regulator